MFKCLNRPYKIYILLVRYNFVQAICTIFEIIQLHKNAKSCAEAWQKCLKVHVHCNKFTQIVIQILAWLSYCSTYRIQFLKPNSSYCVRCLAQVLVMSYDAAVLTIYTNFRQKMSVAADFDRLCYVYFPPSSHKSGSRKNLYTVKLFIE